MHGEASSKAQLFAAAALQNDPRDRPPHTTQGDNLASLDAFYSSQLYLLALTPVLFLTPVSKQSPALIPHSHLPMV